MRVVQDEDRARTEVLSEVCVSEERWVLCNVPFISDVELLIVNSMPHVREESRREVVERRACYPGTEVYFEVMNLCMTWALGVGSC